ncbi:LPS export ABC transporter periplasmic protein LptC [Candidatus Symbiobacter mobilis]|uniref:Lipopolysaccharide export system protein LptC n=1 Tax=Candidatus Symbiobacter mobilis CR TaxID=946483 RepID=U5N6K3_9BURK|nr:LPS export ABC transporter periplasmic protein LptC [Candidatus Symbiobacter mobilis]AGX87171.1 lipopolysaccharide export system protein LptC [Candidatus Symbiobacter mobilis CR]
MTGSPPPPWMLRVLSRLTLYSPVLLMGTLASFSYWLVHTSAAPTTPAASEAASPHDDYFLHGFSLRTYTPAGRLRSEIVGAHAKHYPDSGTLDIEGVRIRSFDAAGHPSIASANRALTDADATEVRLVGNAHILQAAASAASAASSGRKHPAMEFRGEFLHIFTTTRRVISDRPIALRHGAHRFTADRLDMDDRTQAVVLDGHVRATLMARATPHSP